LEINLFIYIICFLIFILMDTNETDPAVFNEFIGQTWGSAVTEEILKTKGNFETLRLLRPNTMMTMDYRIERLNVNMDENDVITSFNYA